ncbi:glycosyltransferase family 2 protein [Klenkia soli]|uniref:glycosyltransferase family 2 protein n=1 Tax=Klenkia soli TaxID=1052260 RepID=UPI0013F4D070|nr:glycosyltransferase family 2 protein [Klenkia soli]
MRASVVVPAFNEEAVIAASLAEVGAAVTQAYPDFEWEIVVVDDGSTDGTLQQVAAAAAELPLETVVVRHLRNAGLGGALRTAFGRTRGDIVLVLDADLSYSVRDALALVAAWVDTRADVVIASPYMPGGRTVDVPRTLERRSRIANRLLSLTSQQDIRTLTGMVRLYDGGFLRSLSLKASDVDINVEIIYKAEVLRARIVEVPATLDWSGLSERAGRTQLMSRRSRWVTAKTLVMTYLFRPFWFPLAPALVLGVAALVLIATGALGAEGWAVVLTVLSVNLAVASLSQLQAKRYFEELFFAATRASGGPAGAPPAEVLDPAAVRRRQTWTPAPPVAEPLTHDAARLVGGEDGSAARRAGATGGPAAQ